MDIKDIQRNSMMKSLVFIVSSLLLSIVIASFFIIQHKKEIEEKSFYTFQECITLEKQLFISHVTGSVQSSDGISADEKREWANQYYLTLQDPNRHRLDSLFQQALIKENIPAKTAICFTSENKAIRVDPDSILQKATCLPEIEFRKSADQKSCILLQSYIYLPFNWFLNQSHTYIIVFSWICLSICYIIYDIYSNNKIDSLSPEKTSEWLPIKANLYFNPTKHCLKSENQQIYLTANETEYLKLFLLTEKHELSYLNICNKIYHLAYSNEEYITRSDKQRISKTMDRFRKKLEQIQGLSVSNIFNVGYRLEFPSALFQESNLQMEV